ncbi:MAG: 50S ribosomal protein L19 [Rickettsiales bacterium]|jgi:large subunit ribosomal protein L19|nr:50S ribosomal protein L19 [Rickettsiales bacterium]
MNIVQQLEAEQLAKLQANKRVDAFKAGDVVRVNVKIVEGNNERVQAFEGMVIARKNAGTNSSFTVRKMSHGEGVERIFPLFSPRLESVERVRGGAVRRAKLYYLRGRTGRAARIKERIELTGTGAGAAETAAAE